MISAIILASGYGRRMGKNKLLMTYKNKPLFEHTIEKVMACDFCEKIIVARDERILTLAEDKGFKAIKNINAYRGQSESIKLGLNGANKVDGYMFFVADQPLMDIDTIQLLIDSFNKNSSKIIIPRFGEQNGSPVIFPLLFVDELKALQGDTGGRKVINNHIEDVVYVNIKNKYLFMDVDTEEDYEKILDM